MTTVYLAGLYEYQNGATTKYYEGGAFRRTGYTSSNGVFYALSDHLRSTSVLVNQNGTVNSRNYYYPGACPELVEGAAIGVGARSAA